jgi:3-oxoacid CoA-transferase subunit B
MTQAAARAAISGRSRDGIAQRLAADLRDGYVVNLGVGIPLLIPQYIPADVEVILHAENGVLGLGPLAAPGHEDPDLTDAGKQPVTLITGAAIVDSAMSFAVVRGGHLDVTVLGALQVSARGDLANWYVPGKNPSVGGAMDLVAGARGLGRDEARRPGRAAEDRRAVHVPADRARGGHPRVHRSGRVPSR